MLTEREKKLKQEISNLKIKHSEELSKLRKLADKRNEKMKRDKAILDKYDMAVKDCMFYVMAHKIWIENDSKPEYCNKNILNIESLINIDEAIRRVETPNDYPLRERLIFNGFISPAKIEELHNKIMAWWAKEAIKNKFKNI